jgi:HlyD family secretion protein
MDSTQIAQKSKKKLKAGMKWLILSGFVSLLGTCGWFIYLRNFQQSSPALAVQIATAKQENIEISINESGTLGLGGQQSLKSPGEVTVEKVLVEIGNKVKIGQQLLILRNSQQQNSLAKQDLQIIKQENTLSRSRQKVVEAQDKVEIAQRELREPVKQQLDIRKAQLEIERSRQKVLEAKQKLTTDEKELKQLQVLSEKGFIPGKELQQQQSAVLQAEASVKDAELDVKNKTIELEAKAFEMQRQTELQQKLLAEQAALKEAYSDVNTQIRELQSLQIDRENLQKQLQNNIMTAPITGKVLDVKVNNGDGVKPGDILLTLGNPIEEEVTLELGTLDAAKVKVNQLARVKVIGPDSQVFNGRVKNISPLAVSPEGGGGSGRRGGGSSGQAKVSAIIQLGRPTGKLIPGSQVSVEIIVQQRLNVLAVGLEAIQRSEEKPFIWIKDNDGKAQKRIVTLGLEGATKVEVESGLSKGEKIILPPPDTPLEIGTLVKEAPPIPLEIETKIKQ